MSTSLRECVNGWWGQCSEHCVVDEDEIELVGRRDCTSAVSSSRWPTCFARKSGSICTVTPRPSPIFIDPVHVGALSFGHAQMSPSGGGIGGGDIGTDRRGDGLPGLPPLQFWPAFKPPSTSNSTTTTARYR
eukprot:TRINITY_DN36383_c0_g1_i1.p1 TRINITY_DN36383_c0_g1~~TRINITY_DN36383_c0_g1_i1.p1  ORF type:complete len:132 (-),score=6.26 TRINITY_DN36383_c0_g1_i1:99-494(-)